MVRRSHSRHCLTNKSSFKARRHHAVAPNDLSRVGDGGSEGARQVRASSPPSLEHPLISKQNELDHLEQATASSLPTSRAPHACSSAVTFGFQILNPM